MATILYSKKPNVGKSLQVIPYKKYLKISVVVNVLLVLSFLALFIFKN